MSRILYVAKRGKNKETLSEANTLETLTVKLRELGIDPHSVIIESVPPPPLTRKMGLRITGRKQEWEEIFKMMDKKRLRLSEKDVQAEIEASRKKRRANSKR
jgi:hypothetical protein